MVAIGEGEPPDNVLLVILDTVRARSSYPIDHELTPTITDVGTNGACFHQAITPAPWTLPAHASMFTGRYPTEHGVTTYEARLGSAPPTLAQYLLERGFNTGLFSSNVWVSDTYGLSQGFDVQVLSQSDYFKLFDDGIDFFRLFHEEDAKFRTVATYNLLKNPYPKNVANLLYVMYKEFFRHRGSDDNIGLFPYWDAHTVTECREFIRENVAEDVNFFAVVNLTQAHAPWGYDSQRLESIDVTPSTIAPDETWTELAENSIIQGELAAGDIHLDQTDKLILKNLYESWVHSVDNLANELIQTLESEDIRNDTLVIITSDHGESIARNDVLGHSVTLDRDVTHVPLVMDGPCIPNIEIRDIISLKDIFGTVLSSLHIESDSPSLFDDDGQGVAVSETAGGDAFSDKEKLAKHFGRRRSIFTEEGRAEIRYDADETVGADDLIKKLEDMVNTLDDQSSEDHERAEVGESTKYQLKNLGYMEK